MQITRNRPQHLRSLSTASKEANGKGTAAAAQDTVKLTGEAPLRLILAGPPGSGKGTQAAFVQEKWGGTHLSTGAMLREEVSQGTDLGKEAKEYMDKGELVPDDLILSMVRGRIENEESFILDGFPRSVPQAEGLDEMLAELNKPLTSAVLLDVGDEVIVERLLARGRADDKEDIIRNRLKVYHQQTKPMIAHFREQGLVETVPVAGTIESNKELVMDRVAERLGGAPPELSVNIPPSVLGQVEAMPGASAKELLQNIDGLVAQGKAPYAPSWGPEGRASLTADSKSFLQNSLAVRPELTLPELTEACKLHTDSEALAVDTTARQAKYAKMGALLGAPVFGLGLLKSSPVMMAVGAAVTAGSLLFAHHSAKASEGHQETAKALGGTRDLFEGWSVKLSPPDQN